jgi:ribosomal protein L22
VNKGIGRHAQAKQFGRTQGGYPTKSVYAVLKLLRNAEANAQVKLELLCDVYSEIRPRD